MNDPTFYNQIHRTTQKINKAWVFSLNAHAGQLYGEQPYARHLEDVALCLEKFGFNHKAAETDPFIEEIICAGWLHDVVEDTKITIAEIEKEFGHSVADIVARVTDEPGMNRAERKSKTYLKIRGHLGATIVKLSDRISNVKASLNSNEPQFIKYVEEQKKFFEATYVPMVAEPMWNELRRLTEKKYSQTSIPLTEAILFRLEREDIKINVRASYENEYLCINDNANGRTIESINNNKIDYERVLKIAPELKNSVLLALLKDRFSGNSAYSEIRDWLKENSIPFESWSD